MWNGSFDCRFTYHFFGIDLVDSLYIEGMLAKHTIDEWFPFGLKEVGVKIYGDQEKKEQLDFWLKNKTPLWAPMVTAKTKTGWDNNGRI